jgi:hypothetical protein
MLAQAPRDVLDVDDRVVDDDPDRDHEPGQDHRVDGGAGEEQDEPGGREREWDGHQTDQRRPPLEQEGQQDEEDEQGADQQGAREVAQSELDEIGRPEDRRVDLDPLQARSQLVERILDATRDIEGVRPRELLDDEHQARTVVDDGVPDERLMVLDQIGDIGQADLAAVAPDQVHMGEVTRRQDRRHVADGQSLVGGVDEAALGDDGSARELQDPDVECLGDSLHDLLEGDLVLGEPSGLHLDLQHLQALAPDRDVRHPRDAQQAGPDLPVGRHRHVDERDAVGREADLHDPRRGR